MFHGNLQHTGVYDSGVKDWTVLWKFPTGHMVRSSAAVSGGIVFVGSQDHHLYAIDAVTGKLKWMFAARGAVASSPAVVDGRVYFTDGANVIYALDATNGKLAWSADTGADLPVVGGWDFYQSSPAVVDGVVYAGSGDGSLYALNARTGERNWSFTTRGRVHTSPAVLGDTIVFGSMDGGLYAINRAGKLLWKYQTDVSAPFPMTGVFVGSPTIAADLGLVFAGARDGHLYAFELASGKLHWNLDQAGSWVVNTPAYDKGILYSATSDSKLLQAIDGATGKVLWKHEGNGYEFSSPIVAGDSVYAGFWSAMVAAFQKQDGKIVNGNGGEGPVLSSPVLANGILYIGCDDGNVYAFH
jgi:outer membrane protein assembly factor BamB